MFRPLLLFTPLLDLFVIYIRITVSFSYSCIFLTLMSYLTTYHSSLTHRSLLYKIMEKKGTGANEKLLFHGTSKMSMEQIKISGFNRSYAGVNGTVYGSYVRSNHAHFRCTMLSLSFSERCHCSVECI